MHATLHVVYITEELASIHKEIISYRTRYIPYNMKTDDGLGR